MKHFSKLTAAAAAVILAATSVGCSAPGAITIGSGTKNAVTIDGYDVRSGIFIFNELQAYNEAYYKIYQESGSAPSNSDIQDAKIEDLDSEDWIQNKATDYCKQYVGILREFEKVGEELSADDLKKINDGHGHDKGDEYLKTASRLICRTFQHSPVFRIGGDEFAVVLQNEDFENREDLVTKFETERAKSNAIADNPWDRVNVSMGLAVYDADTDPSVIDVARRADKLMYKDKYEKKAAMVKE